MRIGIDCRLWNATGVGRYIRNLVENLSKIDKKNEYVLFCLTSDKKELEALMGDNFTIVSADIPWHTVAEQIKFPKIINKFDLDLMHFPYFSVPVLYFKPFMITLHDLIVSQLSTGRASTLPIPIYMAKRMGYHAVLGNAVQRSKKIIVPSEAVKKSLYKEYFFLSRGKTKVIHEGGFDVKIQESKGKSHKISGKYLLRVGNYYPHKNVEGLLKAFSLVVEQKRDLKLVLVGKKDYFYERMEKLVQKLNIGSNVLFLDNIDDMQLAELYKSATATIVPSFAEGFSLTAVEAMSCGSPVLASDIPVHREVCETSAIYFNPRSISSIAERIGFVFDLSENSRSDLIKQGKKQAEKFSWRKMAEETLNIYNNS